MLPHLDFRLMAKAYLLFLQIHPPHIQSTHRKLGLPFPHCTCIITAIIPASYIPMSIKRAPPPSYLWEMGLGSFPPSPCLSLPARVRAVYRGASTVTERYVPCSHSVFCFRALRIINKAIFFLNSSLFLSLHIYTIFSTFWIKSSYLIRKGLSGFNYTLAMSPNKLSPFSGLWIIINIFNTHVHVLFLYPPNLSTYFLFIGIQLKYHLSLVLLIKK